jgi:adenylate cyclase
MADPAAGDSVERERTWLVRRLPEPLPAGTRIAQGYLAHDGSVAVRVRRRGDRHVATVKGGTGRTRVEVEWDLTPDQFEALWPLSDGRRIEKVRHEVPVDGGTAELDVFGGDLDGLVLVEVEFDDEGSMAAFEAPDWFGPEVSDDERYANGALARDGLPDDHPAGFPEG